MPWTKPGDFPLKCLPYVLALCAALGSFRGAMKSDVVSPDAARHAMNGAFLLDWVWSGSLTQPVEFAKQYYAHLPSISLPYHPPMFPAIEAVMFQIFGVSLITSRAAIALFVGLAVLLFYGILFRQYGNHIIPISAVCIFFTLEQSIRLSTDVLLEFPSLTFALAAMTFFREVEGKWRLRDGLLFALFGGIAVWTKQHAVFIGLVPFVFIVLTRKWHLLAGKTLWISIAVYSALVLALIAVCMANTGVGIKGQLSIDDSDALLWSLGFYTKTYFNSFGIVSGTVFAIAGCVYLLNKVRPKAHSARNDLMLSWVISVIAMLAVLAQHDQRYIFFAYPAIVAIGVCGLFDICSMLFSPCFSRLVLGALVVFMQASNITTAPSILTGVSEAAEFVIDNKARRVLYCGYFDGSFCFALRTRSGPLDRFVIRGDKLEKEVFESERLAEFLHRYGVEFVIVEQNTIECPWDHVIVEHAPMLELEREIKLDVVPISKFRGKLFVFRFHNPSAEPENPTALQLSKMGSYLGKYTGVTDILERTEDGSVPD